MTRSSKIPLGLMVDLSASSKMVGFGLGLVSPVFVIVSIVMTLITTPKYTSTLGILCMPNLHSNSGIPRIVIFGQKGFSHY